MAEEKPAKEEKKQFMSGNLLKDINKKNKKKQSKKPNDIELPPTPQLPIAKVKLSWLDEAIEMKVLMFYHSKPHIFGCQFSNLFYSPFEANTRWLVPTKDKTIQTLMNYENDEMKMINNQKDKPDADDNNNNDNNSINMLEFQSSESIFQAAKAKNKIDALFVQSLSPGDAARAGQARLKMSNGLAKKYKKMGGDPFKISNNHWQFRENDKRYQRRENWHVYKFEIMNYALRLKFKTYYNLIKEYVDSEIPIYFVEHTKHDKHWADGYDGNGTNYLGKYLTALCWEYRLIIKQKKNINDNNDDDNDENKDNDNDKDEDKIKDIEWTIDTMSDKFLKWLNEDNINLIENGKKIYQENADCEWLK